MSHTDKEDALFAEKLDYRRHAGQTYPAMMEWLSWLECGTFSGMIPNWASLDSADDL